ncbi:hypothetical protein DSO57_1022820 [Entomophthora muscae]|uniref:Uncharacterized protein n=1 Tax=Entomophthora muscae TaxID=34485 RepID=A0ACC2UNT2_9FUNG|nr:hypothetical protein DSO57_1022820 [Entomophthora muscae]
MPPMNRVVIAHGRVVLNPNMKRLMLVPNSPNMMTGFLPILSESIPHGTPPRNPPTAYDDEISPA